MSRRQGPSDVRGPTSALTAFLKSKNIRVQNANRFRRRDGEEEPVLASPGPVTPVTEGIDAPASMSASSSASSLAGPSSAPAAAESRRPRAMPSRRANASMNFEEDDDTEEEEETMPARSHAGKRAAEASASKGKGDSGSDKRVKVAAAAPPPAGSSQAASSAPVRRNVSYKNTQAGSIDFCANCANRFTVTAYTKHTPDGGLCHKCGSQSHKVQASGSSTLSYPQAGASLGYGEAESSMKKKATPRRKVHRAMHEFDALPTLQSLCINIVSNCIEDVEALIGIGGQNMDKISKSISKNRRLNSKTVQLFLQPHAKKLSFYDCSNLDSDALASIAKFSPFVEDINLQLCGQLDNAALDAWISKLKHLRRVELYGCYLVRVDAWYRFFETMKGRLTSFKIRESPRFDKSCFESLLKNCPNVTELGLAQIGPLNASCLALVEQYGHQLIYLDISDPGVSAPGIPAKSLNDEEVISLLGKTGRKLSYLNLSRNADLTSRTLLEGVLENCKSLNTLLLTLCSAEDVKGDESASDYSMQAEDFVQLFEGLKKRGCATLTHISLERCLAVDDSVVRALVDFSGMTLVDININSCDSITEQGFKMIANGCPNLEKLDVGFCRKLNDACLMDLINKIVPLKEVWVFSCNKISDQLNSRKARIIGKEKYA